MTLEDELVKILSNCCGETGSNEGAVATLNRKLTEIKTLRNENRILRTNITYNLNQALEEIEKIVNEDDIDMTEITRIKKILKDHKLE